MTRAAPWILCGLLLAVGSDAMADVPPLGHALRPLLQAEIDAGGPPGLVVAVVRRGRPPVVVAAGVADLETGRPADIDTVFPVASVSKPVTATLVLRQIGAGRLAFETPANRYLPERQWLRDARGEPARATIGQLLTHTSGLPVDVPGLGLPWRRDPRSPSALLDQGLRTRHPPGQRIVYSNRGYAVVGHLAAQAESENLPEHAERVLFGPTGMSSSQFRPPVAPGIRERVARSYEQSAAGHVAVAPKRFEGFAPAAGLWTSAPDLARFAMLLLDRDDPRRRRVFGAAPLDALFAPRVRSHPDGDPARSAGFVVGRFRDRRAAWHNGARRGSSARIQLLPDDGVGVVVLANGRNTDAVTRLSHRVLTAALELPFDEPADRPVTDAEAERLVGHYRIDDAVPGEIAALASFFELRISRDDTALSARVLPVGDRFSIVARPDGALRVVGGSQDGARVSEAGSTLHLGFLRAERIASWHAGTRRLVAVLTVSALAVCLAGRAWYRRRSGRRPAAQRG